MVSPNSKDKFAAEPSDDCSWVIQGVFQSALHSSVKHN